MADVLVKERLLKKLERAVDEILEQREEYLSEADAAKFLGVKLKTMQNHVSAKKILPSMYVTNVLGARMYKKSKLVGNEY